MPLLHEKRSSERSAWPNAVAPSLGRASIASGTPSEPNAVSIDARERSSEGQTIAISSGAVPSRDEIEDGLGDELERRTATGSLEEANRAVERHRRGAVVEEVALEVGEPGREIRRRAGRELDDVAARERSEVVDVRESEANAARPGSYGSETCTSPRAASASISRHSAPVRSSNP